MMSSSPWEGTYKQGMAGKGLSPAKKIALFLMRCRKYILEIGLSFIGLTFLLYWYAPDLLTFLQVYLDQRLAFFGVMEPIIALLKIASVVALSLLMPVILWRISQVLIQSFGVTRKFALGFIVFSLFLFYSGVAFCFFITLPFGINFLLSYQSQQIRPVISVGKFVNFVGLFLLGFGLIFELPLIMTVLCKLGICSQSFFRKGRRFAILIIAILAAVLTPTPDVVNMALMGLPLYILYEIGILISRILWPENNT